MPRNWNLAQRVGLTPQDFDCLAKGQATHAIANALGVTMTDIDDFIEGHASASMMTRLGLLNLDSADELARLLGPSGARGILFGLLLGSFLKIKTVPIPDNT